MRIVSNGSFDPLCPSPLAVANAHTIQPRPILFREIIRDTFDNGQMRCEPCIEATFGSLAVDHQCFCGCFEFDLPQLFSGTGLITGGGSNTCNDMTTLTAPETIVVVDDIPTDPFDLVPDEATTQCLFSVGQPTNCVWSKEIINGVFNDGNYQFYYLYCGTVPDDNITISSKRATLIFIYQRTYIGSSLFHIGATYSCDDFAATGGVFTQESESHSILGACAGGTPTWEIPTTITVRGTSCDSSTSSSSSSGGSSSSSSSV